MPVLAQTIQQPQLALLLLDHAGHGSQQWPQRIVHASRSRGRTVAACGAGQCCGQVRHAPVLLAAPTPVIRSPCWCSLPLLASAHVHRRGVGMQGWAQAAAAWKLLLLPACCRPLLLLTSAADWRGSPIWVLLLLLGHSCCGLPLRNDILICRIRCGSCCARCRCRVGAAAGWWGGFIQNAREAEPALPGHLLFCLDIQDISSKVHRVPLALSCLLLLVLLLLCREHTLTKQEAPREGRRIRESQQSAGAAGTELPLPGPSSAQPQPTAPSSCRILLLLLLQQQRLADLSCIRPACCGKA
jgi:hypothetical protein